MRCFQSYFRLDEFIEPSSRVMQALRIKPKRFPNYEPVAEPHLLPGRIRRKHVTFGYLGGAVAGEKGGVDGFAVGGQVGGC